MSSISCQRPSLTWACASRVMAEELCLLSSTSLLYTTLPCCSSSEATPPKFTRTALGVLVRILSRKVCLMLMGPVLDTKRTKPGENWSTSGREGGRGGGTDHFPFVLTK